MFWEGQLGTANAITQSLKNKPLEPPLLNVVATHEMTVCK